MGARERMRERRKRRGKEKRLMGVRKKGRMRVREAAPSLSSCQARSHRKVASPPIPERRIVNRMK